ncbi:MAG: RDD family protein [Actinobacteria bacterium]|nr:RDD family protein [Actinomycetota bacterium]
MLNPITHGKSFLRYIIFYTVSSLILGLGFIMVAFIADKRGLHDLISGTCVIHEK